MRAAVLALAALAASGCALAPVEGQTAGDAVVGWVQDVCALSAADRDEVLSAVADEAGAGVLLTCPRK